jgi:predicted Zn finger-like uncharacterized protein
MPLMTACPQCAAKIRFPDNAVGRQIKCPKCGTAFTATAGGAPPPASRPAPTQGVQDAALFGEIDAPPEGEEDFPVRGPRSRSSNTFGDFLTFRIFIAPVVIQVLFWVGVLGCVIYALIALYGAIRLLEVSFGLALVPLFISMAALVLGPIMVRLYCETLIVFFRIYDTLREIKEINQRRGP